MGGQPLYLKCQIRGLDMSARQKRSQHNIVEAFSAYFPYFERKLK
jgi:hypothetical protein